MPGPLPARRPHCSLSEVQCKKLSVDGKISGCQHVLTGMGYPWHFVNWYPFIHLGGERKCGLKIKKVHCQRLQNDSGDQTQSTNSL